MTPFEQGLLWGVILGAMVMLGIWSLCDWLFGIGKKTTIVITKGDIVE